MKKWISLLLAGILVSSVLVGCKKDEAAEETTGGETTTTGGTATAGTAETTGK